VTSGAIRDIKATASAISDTVVIRANDQADKTQTAIATAQAKLIDDLKTKAEQHQEELSTAAKGQIAAVSKQAGDAQNTISSTLSSTLQATDLVGRLSRIEGRLGPVLWQLSPTVAVDRTVIAPFCLIVATLIILGVIRLILRLVRRRHPTTIKETTKTS